MPSSLWENVSWTNFQDFHWPGCHSGSTLTLFCKFITFGKIPFLGPFPVAAAVSPRILWLRWWKPGEFLSVGLRVESSEGWLHGAMSTAECWRPKPPGFTTTCPRPNPAPGQSGLLSQKDGPATSQPSQMFRLLFLLLLWLTPSLEPPFRSFIMPPYALLCWEMDAGSWLCAGMDGTPTSRCRGVFSQLWGHGTCFLT